MSNTKHEYPQVLGATVKNFSLPDDLAPGI